MLIIFSMFQLLVTVSFSYIITVVTIMIMLNFVVDCLDGTLAYASSCYYDDVNNRPLVGYTNICPQVCAQK